MKRCVGLASGVLLAGIAQAGQGVILGDQYAGNDGIAWTLGYSFTAKSTIQATELMAWDDLGDGFVSGSLAVGLWDSAGNLLASTTVSGTDTLTADNFRSRAITPVTLIAGQTYIVAAENREDSYHYDYNNTRVVAPEITWLSDRYIEGANLAFPTYGYGQNSGVNGWYGGNFGFTAIPLSPAASMGLGGLACVGGVSVVRRRKLARV